MDNRWQERAKRASHSGKLEKAALGAGDAPTLPHVHILRHLFRHLQAVEGLVAGVYEAMRPQGKTLLVFFPRPIAAHPLPIEGRRPLPLHLVVQSFVHPGYPHIPGAYENNDPRTHTTRGFFLKRCPLMTTMGSLRAVLLILLCQIGLDTVSCFAYSKGGYAPQGISRRPRLATLSVKQATVDLQKAKQQKAKRGKR